MRKTFAVVLGLLAGGVLVAAIQMISVIQNPMPEGLELSDKKGMAEFVSQLPTSAFAIVLIAHAFGALFGAFVSTLVMKQKWLVGTLIIGFAFLLGGISNLISIPHPDWFKFVDLASYFPAAFIGAWAGKRWLSRRNLEEDPA